MANEKHSMSLSKKRTLVNTVSYIVLALISIIWILPFIFLVFQSFRTENTGIVNYVFPKITELLALPCIASLIVRYSEYPLIKYL